MLLVPVLLFLAAHKLWGCVPRWIPGTIAVYAGAQFLISIPSLMFNPLLREFMGDMGTPQFSIIFTPIAVINWVTSIAFGFALFALAQRVRVTAMQLSGNP